MTQKYTKVTWQDETTSQQGTLINAERLDQMQTAHHYADGFEEVDAVPTEDPGVDYHKVVFCTADTTFYRWDGTAWVKDVDDDTKALLLAHEADHSNPHVVTKAQVGLGNCDNTSDADKPVSTAMQTALDAKITANAAITGATKIKITYDSKGLVTAGADLEASDIPDIAISQVDGLQTALDGKVAIIPVTSGVKFYSQSSGGTSLYQGTSSPVTGITSVPMRDSSGRIKTAAPSANDDAANKKYVDDADALKINTAALVSAWQGTPDDDHIPTEKLVKDSLDLKINTSALVSAWQVTPDDAHIPSEKLVKTYIDTSLTDGSVTKVGTATVGGNLKPVYLNAGVPTAVANDLVDVASAQTITAVKTFNANPIVHSTTQSRIEFKSDRTSGDLTALLVYDGNNNLKAYHDFRGGNDSDACSIININGSNAIQSYKDHTIIPNNRAYNASNTTDVVTIGTLDNYTPMVRTTGNQTISGLKKVSALGASAGAVSVTSSESVDIIKTSLGTGNYTYHIPVAWGTHYDGGFAMLSIIVTAGIPTAISSVDNSPNTKQTKFGAREDNGAMIISMTPAANSVMSAMAFGCSRGSGVYTGEDMSVYGTKHTTSSLQNYVQEA